MNTCQFEESLTAYHIQCKVCLRIVTDCDVVIFGRRVVNRLICGEPSVIDFYLGKPRKDEKVNELIGQEGGRWDHLYR